MACASAGHYARIRGPALNAVHCPKWTVQGGASARGSRKHTFFGKNKKRLGEFNLLANEWQGLGKGGEVSG